MITSNITPYTEKELAVLIEEFIIQRPAEFTLKELCSYIVYWGMEDGRIKNNIIESTDRDKINVILSRIIKDSRIQVATGDTPVYKRR